MANSTITSSTITVHGRGSLFSEIKFTDANDTQIDASAFNLTFEVDGIPISTAVLADPNDALGRVLLLDRDDVASLFETGKNYALVLSYDFQGSTQYCVIADGKINRRGYVGTPDGTEG